MIPPFEILAAILDELYSSVLVINPGGTVELANRAICELFHLAGGPECLRGESTIEVLAMLLGAYRNPEAQLARIKEIVRLNQPVRGEEVPMKNGKTFLRDFIPLSIGGRPGGRIWHHTDISALKTAEHQILQLLREKETLLGELAEKNRILADVAATDALTGLSNRHRLESALPVEMERCNRYGEPLSLILLDIDHFKRVNDTFGHPAGDAALCSTARVIQRIIREPDSSFRWGGEEFIVLVPHTRLGGAVTLAEKLREAISAEGIPGVGAVTASFGVAEFRPGESREAWFQRVDQALYSAKQGGRNRVVSLGMEQGSPLAMVRVEWRDEWNSGQQQIDAEHRELIDLVNEILDLSLSESEPPEFAPHFDKLLAHIEAHFVSEEKVLAAMDWSGLEEHARLHRALLVEARSIKLEHTEPGGLPVTLFNFLVGRVLVTHLLHEDKLYFSLFAHREP